MSYDPIIYSPVVSYPSRSIVTTTASTGFQISSTRLSMGRYSVTMVTTATIGGASSGTVFIEIAPTNSTTPSDWVEAGRFTNGQTITLAVALNSVQTIAIQLSATVPAGYYVRLRSLNNSGTPTFTLNSSQETTM